LNPFSNSQNKYSLNKNERELTEEAKNKIKKLQLEIENNPSIP
jgi:hypothetical protein